VLDVRGTSPYTHGAQAPLFWGFLGMIVIETMVIGSFVSAYFYLRAQAPEWPPAGTKPPELLLPTLNTVVLLASSLALHWGETGAKRGARRQLAWGLLGSCLLAAAFLTLKGVEYADKEYQWDTHAYGSIVWTIVGFHSAHVIALLAKTSVVTVLAFRGYFDPERRLGVTVNGIYWHFVVVIWVPLYVVLYLVPRL
jgi:heme/copper-type cytochrome/quinol oxidase subunit 3